MGEEGRDEAGWKPHHGHLGNGPLLIDGEGMSTSMGMEGPWRGGAEAKQGK